MGTPMLMAFAVGGEKGEILEGKTQGNEGKK